MAKRILNPSIGEIIGTVGDLVCYQRNGKSFARRRPVRKKPFQAAERANQQRFYLAQQFANAVLTVPEQRARYEKAAEGTDASAHNLAVSDFYRYPSVGDVDVTRYTGRAGEFISIHAEEGRIGVAAVLVRIEGREAMLLEEGHAVMAMDGVTWSYAAQSDLGPGQPLWITVTAIDQARNKTIKTVRHLSGT